jgi:glycosyltransferase involved in cell wall biosynthesis
LSEKPPHFSIIVPTRGDDGKLLALLAALRSQTFPAPRRELIVAFDGAAPSPAARATLEALDGREVWLPERLGPGAARNAAALQALGEWIAFTEDDCVPAPDWLARAEARIEADPEIDALEGETVTPAGSPVRRREGSLPNYLPTNLFIRRELFDRIGGYCDRFFDAKRGIYFREDSDLGFTLEEAGARITFDPGIRVTHPAEHPGFLDPLRWARRYEMDAVLRRRHPKRFRSRIEIARIGPFLVRRPLVRACVGYVVAVVSAVAALALNQRGLAWVCAAIASLLLLPVWAKWRFSLSRLILLPLVPFVIVTALARGYLRR